MADASKSQTGVQDVEPDPKLVLITEVFRPYLVKHFKLNVEFLGQLTSTGALASNRHIFTDLVKNNEVSKLLDLLEENNHKGTYAAFIDALRQTSPETECYKHFVDLIEGVEGNNLEEREYMHTILKLLSPRFCEIDPIDVIIYLKEFSQEDKQLVESETRNQGQIRGAWKLLGILLTKGKKCVNELIEGLRQSNMVELADEMKELLNTSESDSFSSPKLGDIDDSQTGEREVYTSGGIPYDGNTEAGASLGEAGPTDTTGELSLCTTGPSDVNINSSTDEKKQKLSDKMVLSEEGEGQSKDNLSALKVIPIQLYGYQKELVAAALQGNNSVIVAPTGSGKTVVAARLAKAVLDREPGVGARRGDGYPLPNLAKDGSNKVIFIVNKVPLVKQQGDVFRKYIDRNCIMGLSGEDATIGSLMDLLEGKDVLVMTAQILVNALLARDGDDNSNRMDLSKIGLLILDECHHCQKGNAYNEIMAEYCDMKLSSPEKARPQVLGLTASMGVGKAKSRYKAQGHILNVCANLDAAKLCTVQNPDNLEELKTKRDTPTEEIIPVGTRKRDLFRTKIDKIMETIEEWIAETPGGDAIHKDNSDVKCPTTRGSQVYEQWVVNMENFIAADIKDDTSRLQIVTCIDHLKAYNSSLFINRDARTLDAVKYLQLSRCLAPDMADVDLNEFQQKIIQLFKDEKQSFDELSCSNENPLLACLSETLIKSLYGKEESRGILFCKTRVTVEALVAWIQMTPELKFLKPGKLIGGASAGMTQKQQTELLGLFRDGNHQLIVATSVAEEGLDIQQCNVVIRYNYISNDIGRVQAKGRNRAIGGKFYLIVSEELGLHDREFMNRIREKMMIEATQNVQSMSEDDFRMQITKFQKENKLERRLKRNKKNILKHSKKLMKVELICRMCGALACTADDIRCIEEAHHVVLNDVFTERARLEKIQAGELHFDMQMLQKIFCGQTSCRQEWGTQMLFKNCLVNVISPRNFTMKMPVGPARRFKKWKEVPFQTAAMSMEELDKVCNIFNIEEDDNSDDDDDEDGGNDKGDAKVTVLKGAETA